MTRSDFIEKSNEKFGANAFDYSQVNYINSATPITLICNINREHGSFSVIPANHLNKNKAGCKICAGIVFDTNSFRIIASQRHDDKYGYDSVNYTGPKNIVNILCHIHGMFPQRAENHYSSTTLNGCPDCAGNVPLTTEIFVSRSQLLHQINGVPIYDYSSSNYINSDTPIFIKCNTHGLFAQMPYNHLRTNRLCGCPLCYNKTEGKLYGILNPLYPEIQYGLRADWCRNAANNTLPFDFAINQHKIIIELDGRQHFQQVRNWGSFEETQQNDKYKMQCANNNGYSVIRLLQEDVLYDRINYLDAIQQAIQIIQANRPNNKNIYICSNNEYIVYLQDTISLSSAAPSAINDIDPDMHQIMNVPNL